MDIHPSVVAALELAVAAEPDNIALRLYLAGLYLDTGSPLDAAAQCTLALQRQPDHAEALKLAAKAATATGDDARAEAYRHLESALGGDPSPAPEPAAPGSHESSTDAQRFDDVEGGGEDWDQILAEVLAEEQGSKERPPPTLAGVGGMAELKRRLKTSFLGPLQQPALRRIYDKPLRGGLLLWGPPGCGKTFLAQAVAGELGARFLSVGLQDLMDIWLGQSEHSLHAVFENARRRAPCVVFLDEVDALGHKRSDLAGSGTRNVVVQLLAEFDDLANADDGVFVLAATNQPWDVDPALRRPGRLDRSFCVLPPDQPAREAILSYYLRDRPLGPVDIAALARRTDRYSGADLRLICDLAAERVLEESVVRGEIRPIRTADLQAALAATRPSTRSWFETARNYVRFANADGEYDEVQGYLRQHRA